MLKRVISVLIVLSFLVLALCSCSNANKDYIEKDVDVIYLNSDNNTSVKARFYDGIPYVTITSFIGLLYRGRNIEQGRDEVTIKRTGDKYTVTHSNGVPGVFDVKNNTFETNNFSLFKTTNLLDDGIEGCVSYDGLPFIKVKSVVADKEATPTKINFGDYNIDIYGDDSDVYLPLTTLSDMYSCQNILVSFFNGENFYVYYYSQNERYQQFDISVFESLGNPHTKALAEFSYNELCLDYDYFLGRSGRSSLERDYDLSNGLDSALKSDDIGKNIIRLIKSNDLVEHIAGLSLFHFLFIDGGHSNCYPFGYVYTVGADGNNICPSWMGLDMQNEVTGILNDIYAKCDLTPIWDRCESYNHRKEIYSARNKVLGKSNSTLHGNETYTLEGDTAIIHIDDFMHEVYAQSDWQDYYNGKTDIIPFDEKNGGAVGAIYFGLKKANEDNAKRVIIDLSANTGGSTDEMLYLISILTNHASLYTSDRSTNQILNIEYQIDRNLDRVFDEKDEEFDLIGDMEIAVLTSQNGFSCGGLCPVYLHDYGIYTLGDNCGGGSCAIYFQHDALGFPRTASSPNQMLNSQLVDIDTVRTTSCDTKLEYSQDSETGVIDFSEFFNIEKLNELIDEKYNKKGGLNYE